MPENLHVFFFNELRALLPYGYRKFGRLCKGFRRVPGMGVIAPFAGRYSGADERALCAHAACHGRRPASERRRHADRACRLVDARVGWAPQDPMRRQWKAADRGVLRARPRRGCPLLQNAQAVNEMVVRRLQAGLCGSKGMDRRVRSSAGRRPIRQPPAEVAPGAADGHSPSTRCADLRDGKIRQSLFARLWDPDQLRKQSVN